MSEELISLHHDKYHLAYINVANTILQKMDKAKIDNADFDTKAIFKELSFHIGGHYLHSIFWENLTPDEDKNKLDYFSDENGNKIDPKSAGMSIDFPDELSVTIRFKEIEKNKKELTILYQRPESDEQFEAMQKSGMVEGWNSSLDKLEKLLRSE